MMTLADYRKMYDYNQTLAKSFHQAEVAAEIVEILSENEGIGMTAKEISEKFSLKYYKENAGGENSWYYAPTKNRIAQLLVKLIDMGKVKVMGIVEYPVTVVNYLGDGRKITFDGWSKVYGL